MDQKQPQSPSSDYLSQIKESVSKRNSHSPGSSEYVRHQKEIDSLYEFVKEEIQNNEGSPVNPVSFGTSGWRGILGKDIFCKSVSYVTLAIVSLYENLKKSNDIREALGVNTLDEARKRGCVLGYDNRFGGSILAGRVSDILTGKGFTVHYAGESTTGCLSAAVLELGAAFSINLTPSHNPLEYAGVKYNAADAGPAAKVLTDRITAISRTLIEQNRPIQLSPRPELLRYFDGLATWKSLVRKNLSRHGLDYDRVIQKFAEARDCLVVIDCVHGATRIHAGALLGQRDKSRLVLLRDWEDPTFGGVAPEPSTTNLELVNQTLARFDHPLKLGVIMDPDGDRVRFTDGATEITMNAFGAMAYHYLHEGKGKKGMVAKTVATSNFANAIARGLGEEVFEPRVGFKEFKPVIDEALVCFEESDGITVIGHTPEKDAYIGLIAALDMVLNQHKNLGDYLDELQNRYGAYYPDKDGIVVSQKGDELKKTLSGLAKYGIGEKISVGESLREIVEVIDIDGLKIILDDDSWLMIRPSGTEPKVRFYVEARSEEGKNELFKTARSMLQDIGLL